MQEHKDQYKEPFYDPADTRVELPKTFKIICCPNCSTEVPADNLNISDKIGKCSSCQAVFSIEEDLKDLDKGPSKITQEILRPEGIELFHYQDDLEVSFEQPMTWLEYPFFFLLIGLIPYGVKLSKDFASIIPILLLTVVPVLAAAAYYFIRQAKHRIFLNIDDEYLNIMWRPKKLRVDKSYKVNDIHQLYVKHSPDLGEWQIFMIVDEGKGQKHVKLSALKTASKAKYLEQEIEGHLKIQNVVVAEED